MLFIYCILVLCYFIFQQSVSAVSEKEIGLDKREMSVRGFYGDTFSDGFGGFRTMKKRSSKFEQCLQVYGNLFDCLIR